MHHDGTPVWYTATVNPKRPIEKIHGAAAIFAFITRDAQEIADYFNVKEITVKRWAQTPEWKTALDGFGYDGDRTFETLPKRDTRREQGETYQKARTAYIKAMKDGTPKHKWATVAGDAVGLPRQRIHVWAIKHGWRDAIST